MFKKLIEHTKKRKKQLIDDRSQEEKEVDFECAMKTLEKINWAKEIRDFMRA